MHDQHLFLRGDTILGVCEAIGLDFGFHPNWLRVALAVGIFFAPLAVILGYVALAVPIALARWAFPIRTSVVTVEQKVEAPETAEEAEDEMLPLAA
jgi:phage shock protein PspC (stress-responsive transcriptional regulator)